MKLKLIAATAVLFLSSPAFSVPETRPVLLLSVHTVNSQGESLSIEVTPHW